MKLFSRIKCGFEDTKLDVDGEKDHDEAYVCHLYLELSSQYHNVRRSL